MGILLTILFVILFFKLAALSARDRVASALMASPFIEPDSYGARARRGYTGYQGRSGQFILYHGARGK